MFLTRWLDAKSVAEYIMRDSEKKKKIETYDHERLYISDRIAPIFESDFVWSYKIRSEIWREILRSLMYVILHVFLFFRGIIHKLKKSKYNKICIVSYIS